MKLPRASREAISIQMRQVSLKMLMLHFTLAEAC
jgi:hypothetical protein